MGVQFGLRIRTVRLFREPVYERQVLLMSILDLLNRWVPFQAWSENGKFYKKRFAFRFWPKREITKEEFFDIVNTKKITSFSFHPANVGNYLSEMINDVKDWRQMGYSPYGERVIITPVEVKESLEDDGYHLYGVWRAETESGEFIHDITFNVDGFTGPAMKRGAKPSEWLPLLFQLHHSGASATKEDIRAFALAIKGITEEDAINHGREQQELQQQ
jgi:hypothetical protein